MISFRPLTSDDCPLLLSWLEKPHVKEWWDDGDDTLEKVAAHYEVEAGTERFLIYCQETQSEDAAPVGYIQSYQEEDGGIGIDLFLGEERFLHRGIGTQVLNSFLMQMIERHNPPYFIVDPEPDNARAIHCYKKVGFRHFATVMNEDGKATYMMRIDRGTGKDQGVRVGGDGGPLVLLQGTAASQWQGANDYENSLMNGGEVETDYDVICNNSQGTEEVFVIHRYNRDMLVLWDSEFGASLLPPHLLLASDSLVLAECDDYTPGILEWIEHRKPEYSLPFNVEDSTLRLQVGADSPDPAYIYGFLDIPVVPGMKRCDVYYVKDDPYPSMGYVVIIAPDRPGHP